jgi:pimeloyl-ACP methyl ester carboxylesterase
MAANRRSAVVAAALAAATIGVKGAAGRERAPTRSNRSKACIVLVHGAWHGGWCWRDVRLILERAGHKVFTPTLTGLGERAHLRDPVPGLETHIQDVVGLIEAEELSDLVLVGHSYSGMVITGVADRLKSRLRHVVYLDAALPTNGQSMITQNPNVVGEENYAQSLQGLKGLAPDGIWMSPLPPVAFGIPPEPVDQLAWVGRQLKPHPLKTWTDPIVLNNQGSLGIARTYVVCVKPVLPQSSFPAHAALIRAGRAGPGWQVVELQTGHDAMVTAPAQTAAIILSAAG